MAYLPSIVIHGGAWAIPDKLAEKSTEGVKTAAKIGYEILMNGGSAVDAVEAAVVSMEDDPAFDAGKIISILEKHLAIYNCFFVMKQFFEQFNSFSLLGRGSVLNSMGEVEMDAVIMEGKKLSAGAVACVQNIPNPIKLARMVMEKVKTF